MSLWSTLKSAGNWRSLASSIRLALLIVAAVGLASCQRDDRPTVIVYTSADEHVARQVIDAFERSHDIRVLMVGDTEVKKTTGLVERLREEKNRPRADVFWSSEVFMTVELAEEGLLDEFVPTNAVNWPSAFRDARGRWFGFGARARVIVFAPERLSKSSLPDSWMDLTNSEFRGRIVMADPRFGTTGGHLGAMKAFWSADEFDAFIKGLAQNEIRMLSSGNAGVVEAVARGEADLGMTDTDDVWAAQARDLNVQLFYPSHDTTSKTGTGTLLIPNTVAIVRNGPNPANARKFAEFLLSQEVERMLAKSTSHNIPVRPGLAQEFPEYQVDNPLPIEFVEAAARRGPAIRAILAALDDSKVTEE